MVRNRLFNLCAFRAGESLQAPGSAQTQAPKMVTAEQACQGGWWPCLLPPGNSLKGQESPHPYASLTGGPRGLMEGAGLPKKETIFWVRTVGESGSEMPALHGSALWQQVKLRWGRPFTRGLYSPSVTGVSCPLWNDVDHIRHAFFFEVFNWQKKKCAPISC